MRASETDERRSQTRLEDAYEEERKHGKDRARADLKARLPKRFKRDTCFQFLSDRETLEIDERAARMIESNSNNIMSSTKAEHVRRI